MRKIALLVVIFVFSSVCVTAQVAEILKRMEQHRKALKSLRAQMTVSKFSVQTGGTYTKEGALTVLPQKNDNNLVRLDSTKPDTENFLIVENQYLVYFPNQKLAYTGPAADSQKILFFIFADLSREKMAADYNVVYRGQDKVGGTVPAWKLELTPKTEQSYQKIELWIDANGMPVQLKVHESNGDWTNVAVSQLQKNVVINAAEFKIALPKNTKIIKAD